MKDDEIYRKECRHQEKLRNINETLQEAKERELLNRQHTKDKLLEMELKIKNNLIEKEKKHLMNTQNHIIDRVAKYDKIKQMGRIKDYEISKQYEKILEKSQIIDEFKKVRSDLASKKREINFQLMDKKVNFLDIYNNIISKSKELNVRILNNISIRKKQ